MYGHKTNTYSCYEIYTRDVLAYKAMASQRAIFNQIRQSRSLHSRKRLAVGIKRRNFMASSRHVDSNEDTYLRFIVWLLSTEQKLFEYIAPAYTV